MNGEDFSSRALSLSGLAGVLLGWRPDEFWAATPAELGAVIGALAGEARAAPPDAATLARLQKAFPDG